ncbi:hypothetical protein [Mucilaginibacter gracilis]|nr:hypothetical protein [Mucilaginibacter gracilis]
MNTTYSLKVVGPAKYSAYNNDVFCLFAEYERAYEMNIPEFISATAQFCADNYNTTVYTYQLSGILLGLVKKNKLSRMVSAEKNAMCTRNQMKFETCLILSFFLL